MSVEEEHHAQISVNIDGSVFEIEFSLGDDSGQFVNNFLSSNDLDLDYQPAVEVEVLRAQLKLSAKLADERSKLRTDLTKKSTQCMLAEQRANLAEQHAQSLSNSLRNVELMLPILLRTNSGEAKSTETQSSEEDDTFVATLQQLLHHHGFVAQGTQDGSLTASHWHELIEEENQLKSAYPSNRQRSSSDEYDQLSDSEPHSWRSRYFSLRVLAHTLSEHLHATQAELHSAHGELEQMSKTVLNDELLQENDSLREQTIKLRGEILKLREHIADVKASAAVAMRTMSELGKEMVQDASRSASRANSRSNSRSATPVGYASGNNGTSMGFSSVSERPEYVHPGENSDMENTYAYNGENSHTPSNHTHVVPHTAHIPVTTPPPNNLPHTNNTTNTSYTPPLPTTPPPSEPVPQEDALDLALRSAQVPIVSDRLLHLLFDRYSSQDGKLTMNSFRYLRCLKDCAVTLSDEEIHAQTSTRYLSYGVVSIVFNDALKVKTGDEHAHTHGNNGAAHPATYKHATTITLKGATDPRTTSVNFAQFHYAMKHVALRLYADVIQLEFGTAVEHLREPVKGTAAGQALELLLQDKIVPLAVKADFMPWPLVHLERALYACAHIGAAFLPLARQSEEVVRWYLHYASRGHATGSGAGSGGVKTGPKSVSVNLFDQNAQVVTNTRIYSIHDVGVVGMTYKALSQFAHDFGVVPYLLKEPQLFGMYQELLAWTGADPKVSPDALPEALARALHSAFQHQYTSHPLHSAAQASAGAAGKGKAGADRISLATFVVALCIVAMQAFPAEVDGRRAGRLVDWLLQGGGPSIIARGRQ